MTYEEATAVAAADVDAFVAPLVDADDPEAILCAAGRTVTDAAAAPPSGPR
ncbi:hypothetical protein [Paractinoplanes toevensis]|uniref:Uncharacterized protein n=1 Tax=Paractinoplanes toevensis TaxID=571911 RepID=A0A919TEY1_9ACTN|nr:hypothetical protein [Actinoplanes toevensis]GIM93160.1 hypothetical protein Ato02nite_049530 [Actinoplanes toevensis]